MIVKQVEDEVEALSATPVHQLEPVQLSNSKTEPGFLGRSTSPALRCYTEPNMLAATPPHGVTIPPYVNLPLRSSNSKKEKQFLLPVDSQRLHSAQDSASKKDDMQPFMFNPGPPPAAVAEARREPLEDPLPVADAKGEYVEISMEQIESLDINIQELNKTDKFEKFWNQDDDEGEEDQ